MANGVGPDGAVTIDLPDGGHATLVAADRKRSPAGLLGALGLERPRPVLVVVGGAASLEPLVAGRLQRQFERGALRAAAATGAAVLDGGTASGVMAVLGEASAASDTTIPLLGVAPAARVTYPGDPRTPSGATELDPNHSHFVLADGDEWGDETTLLFDLVAALSVGHRAAVLVAGGGSTQGGKGSVTADEVLTAVRAGLPVVVLGGSGGFADELAARVRRGVPPKPPEPLDVAIEEIVANGEITVLPLDAGPTTLSRVLERYLGEDATLKGAWERHAFVSRAASRQQRRYRRQQATMLGLGVLLTLLVVVQASLGEPPVPDDMALLRDGLRVAIILIPIIVTALLAAAARLRPGARWILLRGTAEGLKREIFRYRVRAGPYSRARTRGTVASVKLATAVGSAMGALMRTEVNLSALEDPGRAGRLGGWLESLRRRPGRGGKVDATASQQPAPDDRMSPLTPADYIRVRVDSQVDWYGRGVLDRERRATRLRWSMLAFGGMGTFLAAIGLQLWVALTAALLGAVTTWLAAWQIESTVMLYNQAATDLQAVRDWWLALPPVQQDDPRNIDRLVEGAERIMHAEQSGWVQEMQDAMTQLQLEVSEEDRAAAAENAREPREDGAGASNGRGGPGG